MSGVKWLTQIKNFQINIAIADCIFVIIITLTIYHLYLHHHHHHHRRRRHHHHHHHRRHHLAAIAEMSCTTRLHTSLSLSCAIAPESRCRGVHLSSGLAAFLFIRVCHAVIVIRMLCRKWVVNKAWLIVNGT